MKKTTLLIAVLFISVLSASQSFAQAGFQLGVKGGLNFANAKTEFDTEGKTGYHLGAFALVKVGKIGIQPELLFSRQGYTVTSDVANVKSELTTSYVNIPIIMKLYLVQGINLQFGPQIGFASAAEAETTIGNITATSDVKDQIKGTDLSLAFGAGVDLPFGLNVTARYNLGLSNITDGDDIDESDEAKNQVFQVSVGFALIRK